MNFSLMLINNFPHFPYGDSSDYKEWGMELLYYITIRT